MELLSIWYNQPKRRYKLFKETNFQITITPIQKVPARFNFYKINNSTDHYEIFTFYRRDSKLSMELLSIWYNQPKRRYKLFKETNFQITIKPIQKVPARFNFYKINYSTDHYEIFTFYRRDIKLYSVKISTLSEHSVKLKYFMKVAHFWRLFFRCCEARWIWMK